MPIFVYRTEDGEEHEEYFHPSEKTPETIKLPDGTKATFDLGATMRPRGGRLEGGKAAWPKKSNAFGVHPSQVPEQMRRDPKQKFDRKTGEAIFDSPGHMKGCLKRAGFTDLDGV